MPTYEYACASCGAFDRMRSVAQRDEATECPRRGVPAPRVLGGAPRVATGGFLRGGGNSQDNSNYVRLKHAAGCPCC